MDKQLPEELRTLVREVLENLGVVLKKEYGVHSYNAIESIRLSYKEGRSFSLEKKIQLHQKNFNKLKKCSESELFQITHAFAVALELINACENAYRSFRLKTSKVKTLSTVAFDRSTLVLTAHPTESRSDECVYVFSEITKLLIKALEGKSVYYETDLKHLLSLTLKVHIARTEKPEVLDEARYIYSLLFKKEIIETLCVSAAEGHPVFIRTWVGGDKDGHPGVNEKIMRQSLALARKYLCIELKDYFLDIKNDLCVLDSTVKSNFTLLSKLQKLEKRILSLEVLKDNDGLNIKAFHKELQVFADSYVSVIGSTSASLEKLKKLLFIFPGLVVPLELRENSALITESSLTSKGAIYKMLLELKRISGQVNPRWYVRGLVVSSVEKTQDLFDASRLLQNVLGQKSIPIVPLFESRAALENSGNIVLGFLKNKKMLNLCRREWHSRFEVMLGYSDSAKENGSLQSRVLIEKSLLLLDTLLRKQKLSPIFFHGSGGSVARGGGSVEEQVAWWPDSARQHYKATLQGEMIYRSLASAEIFKSQIQKMKQSPREKSIHQNNQSPEFLKLKESFSQRSGFYYKELITDPPFLEIIKKSTPYGYLDELRIGSRPSQRTALFSVKNLRAIPWVLCWTQTRSLLPIWWGVGSAWNELTQEDKDVFAKNVDSDALLSSFIKLMAFSLAKVDLSVWFFYLNESSLSEEQKKNARFRFQGEYDRTLSCLAELSSQKELLWFRPWLKKSISLRSTMIHPINLVQIIALQKNYPDLLRETVSGIASGMLTTG